MFPFPSPRGRSQNHKIHQKETPDLTSRSLLLSPSYRLTERRTDGGLIVRL